MTPVVRDLKAWNREAVGVGVAVRPGRRFRPVDGHVHCGLRRISGFDVVNHPLGSLFDQDILSVLIRELGKYRCVISRDARDLQKYDEPVMMADKQGLTGGIRFLNGSDEVEKGFNLEPCDIGGFCDVVVPVQTHGLFEFFTVHTSGS